jgi:predicted transcriptional regulator
MLTPAQLRAARALLGWTRDDLSKRSAVPSVTIKGFESLGADSKMSTVLKLRRALEAAGIRFIEPDDVDGPGVRIKGSRWRR